MKKIIEFCFCLFFGLLMIFSCNALADDVSGDDLTGRLTELEQWMENMRNMNDRMNISTESFDDMRFGSIGHKIYDMFSEYSDYIWNISQRLNGKGDSAYRFYLDFFDQDTGNISPLWSFYNSDSKLLMLGDYLKNSNNLKDFYLLTGFLGNIDVDTFNKVFDFGKFFNQFETDFAYKEYVGYLSYEISEFKELNYVGLKGLIYKIFLMKSERRLLDEIPGSTLVNPLPSDDYNVAYRRGKYLMNDFKRKFMCDYSYNKHMSYWYCGFGIYLEQSRNYMLKNEILNRFIFGVSLFVFLLIGHYKKSSKSFLGKIYRYFLLLGLIIVLYASSTAITYNTFMWASVGTSLITFRFACLIYLLIKKISGKLFKNRKNL